MKLLTCLLVLAASAASLTAAPAAAETPTTPDITSPEANKEKASELVDAGNTLLSAKKIPQALEKYEEAYKLYPSPKILLNIAEAHRLLGETALALDYFERFLEEAKLEPGSKVLEGVQTRIDELKKQLGFITVDTQMRGLEVKVDGQSAGKTPISEPIRVGAGLHRVTAELTGFEPFQRDVQVKTGETVRVEISLVPATPDIGAAPVIEPTKPLEPAQDGGGDGVLSKWWFWTGVGAVVLAGVGVGIAVSTGGSDFVPTGELGPTSRTSESPWETF